MLRASKAVHCCRVLLPGLRWASGGSTKKTADVAGAEVCLYEVLGVPPSADAAAIKSAFRARAKLLHPDAQQAAEGRVDREQFVQLLQAYQVLIDTRSRELYDLSRQEGEPGFVRRAAASGIRHGPEEEEVDIDLSWGLSALFKYDAAAAAAAGVEPQNKLDKLRAELQSDFHAALRHAYLGPRLPETDVAAAVLPESFEADERALPTCPELLALVSGRQLLGVVRERRLHLLAAQQQQQQAEALAQQEQQQRQALLEHCAGRHGQQQEVAAAAEGLSAADMQAAEQRSTPRCSYSLPSSNPSASTAEFTEDTISSGSSQRPDPAMHQQEGQEREPDVLEYVTVEGAVLATAVRQFPRRRQQQQQQQQAFSAGTAAASPGTAHAHAATTSSGSSSAGQGGQPEQQQSQRPPAAAVEFFRGDTLLATLEAEHEAATSSSASMARLLSPDGRHTHTVVRSPTPLVRHLTFVAEPGTSGSRKRAVVCRARRAWLPPSAIWLFRPRSCEHDIGGWVIEWGGQRQRHHPAWLDPAVFVLTAAFDSLDYERAKQQPQGLFSRVNSGDETAGGPLRWLRSLLRFHGMHGSSKS